MIKSFTGKYRFLSNFYPCLIQDEVLYPSVEHAYQANKTDIRADQIMVASLKRAGEAKQVGRKLKLRLGWEDMRLDIMNRLLLQKFSDLDLQAKLLATGNEELVEGNWWHDQFWGDCTCVRHSGPGENHLGKLLMHVREYYRGLLRT